VVKKLAVTINGLAYLGLRHQIIPAHQANFRFYYERTVELSFALAWGQSNKTSLFLFTFFCNKLERLLLAIPCQPTLLFEAKDMSRHHSG
jgi:hypothetical protein